MPRNDNQFLSPPAHLPTPLPEVPLHAPEPLAASSGLDHLIDFGADADERHDFSPPFREAQLPDEREETPPLPIPPRIHAEYHQGEDVDTLGHTRTPTLPRSPTRLESLSRTIRTYTPSASVIRNYVPSSIQYIPVPSAIPSPPMVSRPLSYGRFSVDPEGSRLESPSYQYEDNASLGHRRHHHNHRNHEAAILSSPSGVARALRTTPDSIATYPSTRTDAVRPLEKNKDVHVDTITWAHWDILSHRHVLIIAYTTGIQIWDCHDLGFVTEILNLTLESEGWEMDVAGGEIVRFDGFVWAGVLHTPADDDDGDDAGDAGDLLASHRPLLGLLLSSSTSVQHSAFFIYSLKNHQIVQRIALPGFASTFESNQHFIVITTTLPPTVHILSALSFHTLWTISSASLATTTQTVSYLSSLPSQPHNASLDQSPKHPAPSAPVVALSGRLLAYASSSSPRQSRHIPPTSSPASGPSTSSVSSSPFRGVTAGPGFTNRNIGNAAIKAGGSVLSGMKFLGGIAYEAAKNKIVEAASVSPTMNVSSSPIAGETRFFSRSAPTDERTFLSITSTSTEVDNKDNKDKDKVVTPHTNTNTIAELGHHVTVLDLKPLLDHSTDAKPAKVAEVMTSRSQPVARLGFSQDGCRLISIPDNGQVSRVFSLRPSLRRGVTEGGLANDGEEGNVGDGVRMYDLRRGRTSGVVESLNGTRDGRWVAIGTKNRTVHVFPMNPFGGRPDVVGHSAGKVRNVDELPHLVEVAPLVRLRSLSNTKPDHQQHSAPLAFTFINTGDVHIPAGILPPPSSRYAISPTTSADPMSTSPTSPHHLPRAGNIQDILVFEPADGMLSLRRITVDQRPKDQLSGLAAAAVGVGGVVSRSLPVTSVASPITTRISVSPGSISRTSSTSTSNAAGGAGGGAASENKGAGGQGYGQEVIMELVGRSEVMATWNLQRKRDWEEVRKIVWSRKVGGLRKGFGADWLAQAELSTCSRSPRILPRSLYLSHQFTFWTFGEDYHALLRQYQFDVRGRKIHVRREVQVSIGVGLNNTSDRFIEDTSSLELHRHQHFGGGAGTCSTSTSFDDPLASALAGDLATDYHSTYANSVPPILPAYPNGVSGSGSSGSYSLSSKTPAFIRNSIPIRRLGDGMSGGLGRIRREISSSYYQRSGTSGGAKIRSPGFGPRRGGDEEGVISVPLEFDEEDEDFLGVSDGGDKIRTNNTEDAAVDDLDIINVDHIATVGINIGTSAGISASAESRPDLTTGTSADTSETSVIDVVLPATPEGEQGHEGLWQGWESREVGKMVEEIERFDDISVVGFLDEEHQREKEATRERERVTAVVMTGQASVTTTGVRKKVKKGKGRKGSGHGGP